jgi:molecular chaperone DnaJ
MPKRDYYEVLEVERTATPDVLKKAYRTAALKFHPDRNPGNAAAEESFKEASEAYQVLSDEQKRAAYDRYGHAGLENQGFGGGNAADIFSQFRDIFGGDLFGDLFGGGGRRARADGPQRGADLQAGVVLSLKDAALGIKTDVELQYPDACEECAGSGAAAGSRREPCATCGGRGQVAHSRGPFVLQTTCPHCQGAGTFVKDPCKKCSGRGEVSTKRTVKVTIPPGIDDGQTLRVSDQGQPGRRRGPAGHLYVTVQVEAHPQFQRDGADLVHELHVTFPQAALGVEVRIPTLEGGEAKVKVPAGTQSGDTVVLSGAGIQRLQARGKGDLIVVVHVDVPKKLSSKAKKLLAELADELGKS